MAVDLTDPAVAYIRGLPRLDVEKKYAEAFAKNDRNAIRWLCLVDRYFLMSCVLRRPDVREDWLFARIREVEADPDDRLDLWAREHYKSTIITFAGIIQEIIRNPEITVCIFAHNRPVAKGFLRQIKEELEGNDMLKALFPEILWADPVKQAPKWSEDEGIVVRRKSNPKESTVMASGLVDGLPTGGHFRLRVYDDTVTEKSVTTPDMIRKTTEMFDLSDYLGARGGRMWMIGTRYYFGDTYGVVIQRGLIIERRHAATDDGTFEGNPVFLTVAEWEKRKKQPKSTVAAQMLLNPLAGTETSFDIRLLQFWVVRPKMVNVYILVDPSKGKTDSADNTAISVIAIDTNRNKYMIDGWCHRMNLSKRWQIVRDQWKRYSVMPGVQAVWVGYEEIGMQTDLEYFEERMEIEKLSFPIEELKWPRKGPRSKNHRIERMEPDIRMGRLRCPAVIKVDEEGNMTPYDPSRTKQAQEAIRRKEKFTVAQSWMKYDSDGKIYDCFAKFIEEFMFFPVAPWDDFMDATSRIYDMDAHPPIYYGSESGPQSALLPEVYIDGV